MKIVITADPQTRIEVRPLAERIATTVAWWNGSHSSPMAENYGANVWEMTVTARDLTVTGCYTRSQMADWLRAVRAMPAQKRITRERTSLYFPA